MGEPNKPGSESTSGYGPGGNQAGAGQSQGQGHRDQGLEKKKASDADEPTNPGIDPDDVESDDESPAKTPGSDADRPSV